MDGRANTFNRALGQALIQIASEWVKVDAQLAELERLIGKMPTPLIGANGRRAKVLCDKSMMP